MKWVFCTHNQHKLEEVRQILGQKIEFLTLSDIDFHQEISEPYDTLEENSKTKAMTVFEQKKVDCFAEDTGLFVEALQGAPGVHTARYAGEHADAVMNNEKLLNALEGIDHRKAFFKTIITLILDGSIHQFTGVCEGEIAHQLSGQKGFGYDPLFIPVGYSATFADMPSTEKHRISHRSKAFEQFALFVNQLQ